MNTTIYLIEATDSTGTVYRYCSGAGYTTKPSDTPANTFYEPRVDDPALFRQSMFAEGTTGGKSEAAFGEIVLLNTDGGLDALIDLGFDGQPCVVKVGTFAAAYSTFATVITGTIEQVTASWQRITFRLRDYSLELASPLQSTLYGGTNVLPDGVDGVADLKGKPKPRLFGTCNNVTPVCVNTSKLIFQVNSAAITSIGGVYDMGVALTAGTDRANNAALQANAPASGVYDTCLAEGMVRLGSSPAGEITIDVVQGAAATDRTVGQIIKTLATEKLGATRVAAQPIIDLDKAAPYVVGYYATEATTYADAFDQLCNSVGAWYGFDNLGIFWCKQLQAPVSTQVMTTLTSAEIISVERTATGDGDKGVPIWRCNVDYAKNWTKQTSLAGQVAADRVASLGLEFQRVKAEDVAVKTLHALSPELTVTSLLSSSADATTEATRILTMRKVRRDRLNVKVPLDAMLYPDGGFWDDEAISEMDLGRQSVPSCVFQNWLYVFGGGATGLQCSRLDLNNPNGAWDETGVTDLPNVTSSPRGYGTATVNGNFVYLVGGYDGNLASCTTVLRLDLTNPTGAWDNAGVSDLPAVRYLHTTVSFGNYLYVIGGTSPAASATASVIRLDVVNTPTGAWDDAGVSNLSFATTGHGSVVYGNYVYIIGGFANFSVNTWVARLDLTTPTGTWTYLTSLYMSTVKWLFGCCLAGEYVYVIAGGDGVSNVTNTCYRYNIALQNGVWEKLANLPEAIQSNSCVSYNGSVYSIGGRNISSTDIADTLRLRENNNPIDLSQLTSLGRTINIQLSRLGYTSGRPMRIIGTVTNNNDRTINLDLWG